MIKFIINLIRVIFCIFLLLILLIFVYFLVMEKLYNKDFASIEGYTYIHIQDNNMEPDIYDKEYLLVKETKDIEKNDYVVYLENGIKKTRKVIHASKDELEVNYVKISDTSYINLDSVYGKVVYQNKNISNVLNIFTNLVVIIIMIVYILLTPQYTYRRYE